MSLTVDLIYVEGCPNVATAREHLRRALRSAGLPLVWSEWEDHDPAAPPSVRGFPSPTVLINGRDVAGEAPSPGAAACRAAGAPGWEMIRDAIAVARWSGTQESRSGPIRARPD